jgi:alkaline phosphatase D
MKKVKNPNVGPIVGETTPTSVRLFGRGEPSKKYSCGVVRVEIPGGEAKVQFFKLLSDFDFTGVGVVTGLEPDTSHRYKLGWFKSDLELADLGQLQLDWSAVESNTFKTPTASRNAKRTFYVGSCRYNLPWASEDKDATDTRGDKTFRTMRRRLMQGDDVDGLLMLGDQIYADIGSVGVSRRKGFFRLYRGAFRQESLRQLMSMLPTYMTLDDHEIEDNWPAKKEDSDLIGKLPAALYAYMAYQMSHSPLLPHENGRLVGTPDHFWYQFSDGCCDVFMMDVRTERELTTVKKMIDEVQMEALKDFLKGDPDRD